MAVFLNTQTGLLEEAVQPQQGVHEFPLVDAEGNLGSAAADKYQALVQEGYRAPTPEEIKHQLTYAKHSTPVEQAKTFAEGAAKAATLGLSTGIETKLLGVDPEAIRGREETNPGMETLGEVAGLGASLLIPGGGALGAMGKVGEAAAGAVRGAGITSKLGATVAKQAAEMAMIQSGDEVSKAFAANPDQTMQSVVTSVGMAALLGGGLGAAQNKIVEPLWEATKGAKLSKFLTEIRDKAQSTSGAVELDDVIKASGMEVPASVRAAASGSTPAKETAQGLFESSTKSGQKYRTDIDTLYQDASDQALSTLGRTSKDLGKIAEMSEYEEGLAAKKVLETELKPEIDAIAQQYEKIRAPYASTAVDELEIASLQDRVAKIALESGDALRPSSTAAKELRKISKDLTNIKTADDLRLFASSVREDMGAKGLYDLGRRLKTAFGDAEEAVIERALGTKAPELLAEHASAKASYRSMMEKLDALNDRLRVGKYSGPESFLKNLRELTPEDFARRMSVSGDVEFQKLLQTSFPGVAAASRDRALNKILKKAASGRNATDKAIDMTALAKEMDALSPEARDFLFTKPQQDQLNGIKGILERLPERQNPAGTARAIDKHLNASGGAWALIGAMLTGGSVYGAIGGYIAKQLGREVPDAIKLAMLKFIGTTGPVEAGAFKAMVDVAEQAIKSAKMTDKAIKGVFQQGVSEVIPTPSPAKIIHLRDYLDAAQNDPEQLIDGGSKYGTYLPDHAIAAGTLTGRAVGVLNQVAPKQEKQSPLDVVRAPNAIQKAKRDRAMTIVEQPAMVLQYVKDGSITPEDIGYFQTVYPALYIQYKEKLWEEVSTMAAKDKHLPYKTAMGLSLFLGMPLESSLQPQNIIANQTLQPSAQPQQPAPAVKPSQQGLKGLGEMSKTAATPQQARTQAKTISR